MQERQVIHLEFFFDYLSPYAYLAWNQLPALKQKFSNLEIRYTPILLAGLLNHWRQKGPAEIPPKRQYIFTQCFRLAKRSHSLARGLGPWARYK